MPVQKTRVDILPKGGMDPRSPGGVKWIRNMRRWTSSSPLEVRPGFGQRAQIDTTSSISQDDSNNALGGYTQHLGSYLYNSNFGRRQILSVFSVVCSHSSTNSWDVTTWYQSVHGFSEGVVFSVFDISTKETWEELITFKTSESAKEDDLDKAHGHFETVGTYNKIDLEPTRGHDYRSFKKVSNPVSFTQISDSVYFSSPSLGQWVYHGINVPSRPTDARIDGNCPIPQRFAYDDYHSNNLHSGRAEGSVIQSVSGTRGINGRDVVYLTKSEMPRSVGMAKIGGRIAYTNKNVVWFSDVNQPGAVMADNFASWAADGESSAIASYQDLLFVFTAKSAHALRLRPQGSAGAPIPGLIDILSVETNHEAGCVSAASHCWTPYGVCFVSDWGTHIINDPTTMNTISDPVYDHWGDGLKDPLSSYNLDKGQAGTAGKEQAPMLFAHKEAPSLTYDIASDSVMLCYETHILIYHFETKGWSIWPLGVRSNDPLSAGAYSSSFTGRGIVSDSDGVYLISGLLDLDDSTSENPYAESESYVIAELGLGGGPDRTIENEDYRCFGTGRYKLLEPSNSFAGGVKPPSSTPNDIYTNNGWLLFLEPVDEWLGRGTGAGTDTDTQYKSYDVSFLITENAPNPGTAVLSGAVSFTLSIGGGWLTDTTLVGAHSQCGTRSGFTISIGASGKTLSVITPSLFTAPKTKIPLVRLTISNAAPKTLTVLEDPRFGLYAAEAIDIIGNLRSIRMYAWMASYRFPASNNMWNATNSSGQRLTGTDSVSGAQYSFDGATIHRRDVEWGIVTGDMGAGDGAIHRARDIRAFIETGGQDDTSASKFMGLYNASVAPDYKMLSGQKQDYTDPYLADRDALKKETIRDRMTAGKRLFDSVAVWSDGTGAGADDYLVDNPETNEIDISTHARGESVVAAVFGRATSIGTYLRFHKLVVLVQSFVSNRRQGR